MSVIARVVVISLVALFVLQACGEDAPVSPGGDGNMGDLDTDGGYEGDGDGFYGDGNSGNGDSQGDQDGESGDSESPDGDATSDGDAIGEGENEDAWVWPCPAGHRANEAGECYRVPTLLVLATHTLSYAAGVDPTDPEAQVSRMRMVGVSASSSPGDGRLPYETLEEGERCRVYGEFDTFHEIARFNAGPVSIWGLNVAPATYIPDIESGTIYRAPEGLSPPFHFAEGVQLTVTGVGTEPGEEPAFPSFSEDLQTIPAVLFTHSEILPGEEISFSWPESPDADVVRIDIETRNLGDGGIDRRIVCEVLDTGEYTIPAELTSYLVTDAGVVVVSIQQSRTIRIEPGESDVLLMLSANNWTRVTY